MKLWPGKMWKGDEFPRYRPYWLKIKFQCNSEHKAISAYDKPTNDTKVRDKTKCRPNCIMYICIEENKCNWYLLENASLNAH